MWRRLAPTLQRLAGDAASPAARLRALTRPSSSSLAPFQLASPIRRHHAARQPMRRPSEHARYDQQQAPPVSMYQQRTGHPSSLNGSGEKNPVRFFQSPSSAAAAIPTTAAAATSTSSAGSTSPAASQLTDAQVQQQLQDALTQSLTRASGVPPGVDESFFATPYVDAAHHPVLQWTIDGLTLLHDTTGLPWWATLFVAGLGARVLLSPLQVYQARIAAGMAGLEPYFLVLDQKIAALPKERRTFQMMMHAATVKWDLYQRHGCNPWKLLPPTIVQIGVFVTMAIALRSMVYTTPELLTGGALWFTNLAAMDPHWVLPLTAIFSSYAASYAMEYYRTRDGQRMRAQAVAALSGSTPMPTTPAANASTSTALPAAAVPAASSTAVPVPPPAVSPPALTASAPAAPPAPASHLHELQHYLRGLSLLAIPWVVHLPCGIFFFWFAGTLWTHVSAMLLRQTTIRERLGLTRLETAFQQRVAERAQQKAAVEVQPIKLDKRVLPTTSERYGTKPATTTKSKAK